MLNNISVFIPAYSQIKSLEFSIPLLKEVYPECDIHLCSDNGYDFTEFCQKYDIDYKYYDNRLGYPAGVDRYGWTKEKSLQFLQRIKLACEYLKNDFVILFEEDVLVTKKINLDTNFDISGYIIGNNIPHSILDYISYHGGNTSVGEYGAGGGCVFNRKKYIESFDKSYSLLESDFDRLFEQSFLLGWPDFLICFVFMIGGYNLSENRELMEIYDDEFSNLPYSIIHKYKKFYQPL